MTMVEAAINPRYDPASQQIYAFTESPVMSAIYGVLAYQEGGNADVSMGFLKSFTPSADFKTWTAVMRPGLKFSDGTDFNAAAIAYNLQRDADPATGSIFYNLASSLKLDVVDETTLQITLASPNTQFAALFTESFACIGSPTAEKAEGSNFGTAPVGPGPFKIKSVIAGQSITMEPNPYYALYAPGQPYLDQLNFQFIANYPQQLQALNQGSAQVMLATGGGIAKQIQDSSAVISKTYQAVGGGNFLFNNKKAPFNDVIARQAISLALDRPSMAAANAQGTGPATNLFRSTSPYFDAKYDFPGQDKVQAQKLFDQLAAEGKPLDFTMTVNGSFADSVNGGNALLAQLGQFKNVKVTIKASTPAQYTADQKAGNFQMDQGNIYNSNPVPDVIQYFHTGGSLNYQGYSNTIVDAALDDIYTTTDQARIKKDWGVAEEQLNKDFPVYWANQSIAAFAATKNVTGIHVIGYGYVPLWGSIGYAP